MLNKSFSQINLYNKALDASWQKNEAISNNIANVNTPNYKRETVAFEEVLKRAMGTSIPVSRTHENHMPMTTDISPSIVKDKNTSFRRDGNNVNIDTEMAELAENQIKYETITKQLNSNLKRLRLAMSEG
jgi:flagellar basal-body rod protein FlgB